jgi:competence protein ComEA
VAGPALSWREEQRSADLGKEEASSEPEIWYVYITGEVVRPGVYEVSPGDRMYLAVEKAGGFTLEADTQGVNLASPLQDAMHIKIPARLSPEELPSGTSELQRAPREERPSSGSSPSSPLLDINSAGLEELEKLPGIGPVLARRILETRRELGGFKNPGEILKVPGIGTKRLESITPLITLGVGR